jgi:hypothetical protein
MSIFNDLQIVGQLACDFLLLYIQLLFTHVDLLAYLLGHLSRTYVWQGGAGTWSDGKLVTRIGRNSGSVIAVSFT